MKRKTSSRTPKKVSEISQISVDSQPSSKRKMVIFLAIILIAGLGMMVTKKYKNLIVVGKVNGQFITRWQLEKAMNDRYARTVFDELASTTLLRQLVKKNDIVVSTDELETEIKATEERMGGKEALKATLDRLGYSQIRFEEEMRTQVAVKKLAEKLMKIEVTEEEIAKFYQDNKTLFPGKKLDEVKVNIQSEITEQKRQEQFSTWFQEEKKKAIINSYL